MLNRLFQIVKQLSALVGLVFWMGCSETGLPDADEGVKQQILLLGNGSEPQGLDLHLVGGVPENRIISALFEGLIAYHPTSDELPEPGVAERWETNADASTWRFFLREDARWSNGDPVLASDFLYAYERILTAELGAQYANMLYVMKGAEAFHTGKTNDFEEVGVKALDARTLEIQLIGSMPHFINMLKHYSWFPLHRPTIERFGGLLDRSGAWTQVGNMVGNGAFRLNVWKPDQYIKVVKSETYWDRKEVRLNGIIFFPIPDSSTEKRMFESGRLHLAYEVPQNDIEYMRKEHPEWLHIDPLLGVYYYGFNTQRKPLDDRRVRHALAMAIDRETLVEKVSLGGQIPATSFVPAMFDRYPSVDYVTYDPVRARALLAAAGFPNGEGFPVLKLLFNTSNGHRKIAEAIVEMWHRELNVSITLLNKEWRVFLSDLEHLDFDIARKGWVGDYANPMTFLDLYTSGNGNNETGWSNQDYDQLIDEAMRAGNSDAQIERLSEAEGVLMAEMPVAPIYWYTRAYLLDERVEGWHPTILDNHPYKYIYLKADGRSH